MKTVLSAFTCLVCLNLVSRTLAAQTTLALGSNASTEGPGAGADTVVVAANGAWSAATDASWLHLSAGGTGNALFQFSFDANTGPTRTAVISFDDSAATLTVTQASVGYARVGELRGLFSGVNAAYLVAVDEAGNAYINAPGYPKVWEWVAATQQLTTLVSSLYGASGLAADRAGNVYIAERDNHVIVEWVAATQQVVTLASDRSSNLDLPESLAVDAAGNVYIVEAADDAIEEWVAATQQVVTLVPLGLRQPYGLAVDRAGNLYVSDLYSNVIEEWVAATGRLTTLVSSGLDQPTGLAVDGAGNVYIADNTGIKEWVAATQQVATLVSSPQEYGVAVDQASNLYITSSGGGEALQKLTPAWMDLASVAETYNAGSDHLSPVLPLSTPLDAVSDEPWLSITSQTNGVVSFSFTANDTTTARTAHIKVLGQSIAVTQSPGLPQASLSVPSLAFNPQDVNTQSSPQAVTLTNSGTVALLVSSIAISGANASDFSPSACPNVAAGAFCDISVTFKPTAAGARNATLTVTDNSGGTVGATQTVALSGTGVVVPVANLSTALLSFGDQLLGHSAAHYFTLTNTGSASLSIAAIAVGGANRADFVETTTCSSALAAGGVCNVVITFTPSILGNESATVTVTDNSGSTTGATQSVSLSGSGVEPLASLSTTSLTFNAEDTGTRSSPQALTLTNTGTGVLVVSSVLVSGVNASDFSASGCPSLAAGTACAISVTFKPSAGGVRSATLTVTDSGGGVFGATQTASVSGTGIAAPNVLLSKSALAFGDQLLAQSAVQVFGVSNVGANALSIASIGVSGNNSADFVKTTTCGGTLAAGGTCSVALTFTPSALGDEHSTLTITDNSKNTVGATQTVDLSGTGVEPQASLSIATITFGPQVIATRSSPQTVTLTNSGTGTLVVSSVLISGANASDFSALGCPALAAGATCPIAVTFTPSAVGTRSAKLTVTDNADGIGGSAQSVSLSGTGAGPQASLSTASLSFSPRNATRSAPQIVSLSNAGTGVLVVASVLVGGLNGSDFSASGCPSLVPGAACNISVTFQPSASGLRTATLTVTDNAGNLAGSTQTVALSGTGIAGSTAFLSTSSLSFGIQDRGNSTVQVVGLSNTGTDPLSIASITVSGINSGDFGETNTCGSQLAGGATCAIAVRFTPSILGDESATLTLTDSAGNAAGNTQTVKLSGTSGLPRASLSTTSLVFNPQGTGTKSNAQTITLTNSGTAELVVSSVLFSGTNASDFSALGCPSLTVGASCLISVIFSPVDVGSRSATLTITDNSGGIVGSMQTVTLSGTGIPFP